MTKMGKIGKKNHERKALAIEAPLHSLLVGVSDEMPSHGNSSSPAKTEEQKIESQCVRIHL